MAVVLREVARKARVSVATASIALQQRGAGNGRKRMSETTRQRILKVAENLNYAPNVSARRLSTGCTNTFGIAVRDLHYLTLPYIGSVISGIVEVSDRNNFGLSFARTISGENGENEYVRFAREGRFDGIIIIDQKAKISDIRTLCALNTPTVMIDRKIPQFNIPAVRINYRKATKDAVYSLIKLGHRRIAVLTVTPNLFEFNEKIRGYQEALKEHEIPFDENLVKIDNDNDDIVRWTRNSIQQLENLSSLPTAYLSFQDTRTSLVCDILRNIGLRIPQDVSVMGFETADIQCPSLYSIGAVKTPGFELGVRACQLLMDLLKNRSATKDIILEAEFEERESCSAPGR